MRDFSLVNGGPTHHLMRRVGLAGGEAPLIGRRAVVFSLLAWVSLLALALVQGLAYGTAVRVPFLRDLVAYARFLVALPVLIGAERAVDLWAKAAVQHFASSGLVRAEDLPRFGAAVVRAGWLRDSALGEMALLVAAYARVATLSRGELGTAVSTWHVLPGTTDTLSLAGWWYALFSLPLFLFLLYRWGWRLIIWTALLWRTSRLNLHLLPTHPDLAGGLGFLATVHVRLGLAVFALSAVLSAGIGARWLFQGVPVAAAQGLLVGYVILCPLLILAPLFLFTGQLMQCRTRGLLEYGALANRYTQEFDAKWMQSKGPEGEGLLGTPDLQSLADLGNSFAIIRNMRPFPFDSLTVLVLVAAALVPMAPLLFAVMPLADIVKKIMGFLA
jgi:hypothetical protein